MADLLIYKKTAENVASKNGVTYQQAVSTNTDSRNSSMPLKENQHPSKSTIASKIKLVTYLGGNINNNNIVVEKYFIKPSFTGVLPCSGPQSGIWYFTIPNSTYALKFYAPDENNAQFYNIVYCVPAKADNNYLTGFADYLNAVPQEFVDAFIQYASSLPKNLEDKSISAVPEIGKVKSFSKAKATQNISFSFNYWGNLSGISGQASAFSFNFVFYPGKKPITPTIKI